MNNRTFKPIPLPDFTTKCHYTSQIFSCDHREFLKKPRVIHVWPCAIPRGTKSSCFNMAGRTKEMIVLDQVCSKCAAAEVIAREGEGNVEGKKATLLKNESSFDPTLTADDGGIAPESSRLREEETATAQKGLTAEEWETLELQKEGDFLCSKEETVDLVALGKEIVKENSLESLLAPDNLRGKIAKARRKLEAEAEAEKRYREVEDDDWEIIHGDEVRGQEWENGEMKWTCRIN